MAWPPNATEDFYLSHLWEDTRVLTPRTSFSLRWQEDLRMAKEGSRGLWVTRGTDGGISRADWFGLLQFQPRWAFLCIQRGEMEGGREISTVSAFLSSDGLLAKAFP